MSKSQIIFQRWKHVQSHSWPFQVYKLYNEELSGFIWSIEATSKYTYQMLEKNGAKWEDLPTKHFAIPNHRIWAMKDMKGWSDKFNESKNWIRLNAVMAISSNLETYLSSITALAIESNPGVLLGAPPRLIDGAKLLKIGALDDTIYEGHVEKCTKGEWPARLAEFERLFGVAPNSYRDGIKVLERMRRLRNNLGHAFGRDIEASRDFSFNTKQPIDHIQQTTLVKYLELAFNIAKDLDEFLLDEHIGEFQAILAYHMRYEEYSKLKNDGDRAVAFKKIYGKQDQLVGKTFCKGLVEYYKNL